MCDIHVLMFWHEGKAMRSDIQQTQPCSCSELSPTHDRKLLQAIFLNLRRGGRASVHRPERALQHIRTHRVHELTGPAEGIGKQKPGRLKSDAPSQECVADDLDCLAPCFMYSELFFGV